MLQLVKLKSRSVFASVIRRVMARVAGFQGPTLGEQKLFELAHFVELLRLTEHDVVLRMYRATPVATTSPPRGCVPSPGGAPNVPTKLRVPCVVSQARTPANLGVEDVASR